MWITDKRRPEHECRLPIFGKEEGRLWRCNKCWKLWTIIRESDSQGGYWAMEPYKEPRVKENPYA